jgi:membrane protein DedA with SNARE-associated domain
MILHVIAAVLWFASLTCAGTFGLSLVSPATDRQIWTMLAAALSLALAAFTLQVLA